MKNQVCAIFVSYNPSDDIIANVVALINQVDEVVIVDNASCAKSKEYLDYLGNNYKLNIIHNDENMGIATALNIGIKYGISKGYDWIATFDQDSRAPEGYIDAMLNAYESCVYKDKVAIVAPRYLNETTGKVFAFSNKINEGKLFSDVRRTITSGNLVKSNIFSDVGFFDEGLFIDYVDHEFCLRCMKNRLKIIQVYNSILIHNLGSPSTHNLLRIKFTAINHSPLRRYYKYRNMIIVYQRYLLLDVLSFLSDIKYCLVEMITIFLFEEEKYIKMRCIITGISHGLQGRTGKYQQ